MDEAKRQQTLAHQLQRMEIARQRLRERQPDRLREDPHVIYESDSRGDGDVVDAAAFGSLYMLKNGQVHVKLETGWIDIRATRRQLLEGHKLDGIPNEALQLLAEVAERDLLEQTTFVEKLQFEIKTRIGNQR